MENSENIKNAIDKAFEYLNNLSDEDFQKEIGNLKPSPFFKQIAETLVQQRLSAEPTDIASNVR